MKQASGMFVDGRKTNEWSLWSPEGKLVKRTKAEDGSQVANLPNEATPPKTAIDEYFDPLSAGRKRKSNTSSFGLHPEDDLHLQEAATGQFVRAISLKLPLFRFWPIAIESERRQADTLLSVA